MNKTICDKCGSDAPKTFLVEVRTKEDFDAHQIDWEDSTKSRLCDVSTYQPPFELCQTCWNTFLFDVQRTREARGMKTVVRV